MGGLKKSMATKMITPRQNGADISKLTVNRQNFVQEMLAHDSMNPTAAAKAAGYAHPSQAANKLMRDKVIQRALGKAQRLRNERCQLKADSILKYLVTALFFNPASLFTRDEDGGFSVKNLDEIPDEIGCLIESIEMDETETPMGIKRKFKLKIIPHATTLPLAMKHAGLLTEKLETTIKTNIDWDQLSMAIKESIIDPVEQAILDVESEKVEKKR